MQTMIDVFVSNRKWSKTLSVLMIITFFFNIISYITDPKGIALVVSMNIFFYLVPAIALWRYAKLVTQAENSSEPIGYLEEACEQQAKHFKVLGIMSIIVVVLSVAIFSL